MSNDKITKILKQKIAYQGGCAYAVHAISEGEAVFMFTLVNLSREQ